MANKSENIPSGNSCARCRFFSLDEDDAVFRDDEPAKGWGRCLRYAPRPREIPEGVFWPAVHKGDWCGEFEAHR